MSRIEAIGKARWASKRDAGISPVRSDGSLTSAENDINAAAAEEYAAKVMGCEFDSSISTKGDGGFDFVFPLTVEVIWLGMYSDSEDPRQAGHLIVNPYEPHRWADIYVVVKGSGKHGFEIVGWTTHRKLASLKLKDFGFGEKMAMHTNYLMSIKRLVGLKIR